MALLNGEEVDPVELKLLGNEALQRFRKRRASIPYL